MDLIEAHRLLQVTIDRLFMSIRDYELTYYLTSVVSHGYINVLKLILCEWYLTAEVMFTELRVNKFYS